MSSQIRLINGKGRNMETDEVQRRLRKRDKGKWQGKIYVYIRNLKGKTLKAEGGKKRE